MYIETPRALIALAFTALTAQALADDCATVKSAMLNSGHTPHSVILTRTDGQGKNTVTRQVQTVDNKYVQRPDGKWYAMNIAIKDLNDDLSGLQTCRRSGSDSVGGELTAVYEVRMKQEDEVTDQKLWVSSKNMILKSEGTVDGAHYTTEYDYAHVTPPANAIPMGGK
jgi:outer membrane lipoprotein-sorting protein